jgi:hypothetical protein
MRYRTGKTILLGREEDNYEANEKKVRKVDQDMEEGTITKSKNNVTSR